MQFPLLSQASGRNSLKSCWRWSPLSYRSAESFYEFWLTSKTERFLSLMQTGVFCLVILTACITRLLSLSWFCDQCQQKRRRYLFFIFSVSSPQRIREQTEDQCRHRQCCRVCSCSDWFKMQICNCICHHLWQQWRIEDLNSFEQLIHKWNKPTSKTLRWRSKRFWVCFFWEALFEQ